MDKIRREIAADWWIERFKYPVFDNGDASPALIMLPVMLAQDALRDLDPKVFDEFKRLFIESNLMEFYCDYAPETALHDLMHQAKVPMELASWKCYMKLHEDGRISVKVGYGKPFQFIGESNAAT